MTFPQKTLILIALLIFGIVALAAITPYEEPQDPYCEMVGIWIESGGEYGRPDYRKNYHEACPAIPLEGGAPSTQGGGE